MLWVIEPFLASMKAINVGVRCRHNDAFVTLHLNLKL